VGRLGAERDAPAGEVDDGAEHESAGEHGGHRQHGAGPRRSHDHHDQGDAVGDGERAEVPGAVGGGVVGEEVGDRRDQHLDGDHGEQHPQHAPRRGAVGSGRQAPDASRQVGDGARRAERAAGAGAGAGVGERAARRAVRQVGVDEPGVDAGILAVEARRDRVTPTVAARRDLRGHGNQVAGPVAPVPGDRDRSRDVSVPRSAVGAATLSG